MSHLSRRHRACFVVYPEAQARHYISSNYVIITDISIGHVFENARNRVAYKTTLVIMYPPTAIR